MKIRLKELILGIIMLIVILIISLSHEKVRNTLLETKEITHQNQGTTVELKTVNGDKAQISSSVVTQVKTGTGSFDHDDKPGNDSSEDNNIVRSFDQITWTIENTMKLKEEFTGENLTGGIIKVEATLPETCGNVMKWDLASMGWTEGTGVVSADGRIFTGSYQMSETEITIPGLQSLILVLQVEGAGNQTQIQPEIKVWLEGNKEEEKVTTSNMEKIIVSAAPKYNLVLSRNYQLAKKTTVDYGEGNTTGRMYGYGLLLQLYNENVSKGLKGIEYPQGEICFDLNLKLERSKFESTELEDITDQCTPILWNYRINNSTSVGNIANRTMFFGNHYSQYQNAMPYGTRLAERRYSVYNSGNYSMTQNGSTISVKMNNYGFDGNFPIWNYGYGALGTSIVYGENIGCFSVGYLQIFLPENEVSTMENRNYYLTVKDTNFKATSITGTETTQQMVTGDDSNLVNHVLYMPGTYAQNIMITSSSNDEIGKYQWLGSTPGAGDSSALIGTTLDIQTKFVMDINSDDNIYSASRFVKFDGDAFEPKLYKNGSKYGKVAFSGDMSFEVWYVTKKDGTNWTSQTEMNQANIEDMQIYKNIEDIPDGAICVGEFFESTSGAITPDSGDNNVLSFLLKIKETATIGKTYGITERTKLWKEPLDRSIYSVAKGTVNYPQTTWDSGNRQYIKTEYNEKGEMIAGTHSGGSEWGNTVLVTGAKLSVASSSINESGANKINYDISKNENEAIFKIQPTLSKNENVANQITNVTIKVIDTLPKGLTYLAGSSNKEEPEITENEDGTTTLVWSLYNCTSGEAIEAITFKVEIDQEAINGQQYENKVVVIGDQEKIGVSKISDRTATNTIQITNLVSHRLYKTVETPIIEREGEIIYNLSYKNNTEEKVPDFQLLDILPYNGDGRRTSYDGTYTIEKIEIKRSIGETELDNTNLKLYLTSSELVRKNVTEKDEDLGENSIWNQKEIGATIKELATAIVIKGEMQGQEKIDIRIHIKTNNNQPENIYANHATAQISKETEGIQTSIVRAEVIKRQIEGVVWIDENVNGLMEQEEGKVAGMKVSLVNSEGNPVKDIYGNLVESVQTKVDGSYQFENLAKGNYKVKVEIGERFEITKKEVGSNQEINSKFNKNQETDEITKLNSVRSPELKEGNVNLGIYYIKFNITTEVEGEGGNITGEEEDIYEEVKKGENSAKEIKAIPKPGYQVKRITVNGEEIAFTVNEDKSVTLSKFIDMQENKKIVVEFEKASGFVEIKYVDRNTKEEIEDKITKEGIVGEKFDLTEDKKEIPGYTLVEEPEEKTGTYTEEIQEKIYYYAKNTKVLVKYLEKDNTPNNNTDNMVLATEEIIEGYEGKAYTTVQKAIENYTFVEATNNTQGKMTRNTIEVIYYYAQNTKATVQHIDRETGEILKQETTKGKVGDLFETQAEDFKEYVLVITPEEPNVIMTKDEQVVKYYYAHISAGIIEKHIDNMTGELLYSQGHQGKEGDSYNIPSKEFKGYDLVEEKLPNNSVGKMERDLIEVKYYYIKKASVKVEYIDLTYNKKLTEDILINGHENDNYTTEQKEFEGYTLVEVPENAKGKMTITKNEDGINQTEIVVTYYYKKQAGGAFEKHIDINTNEILAEQNYSGNVGDSYDIPAKEFEGYKLVEEKLPTNSKGEMKEEEIVVRYYYQRKAEVEIQYIEKETGYQLAQKDRIKGYVADGYETESKDIPYYNLIGQTENTKGSMTKEKITVIYYYEKQIFNLSVDKWISQVCINGNTQAVQTFETKDEIYKLDIHRKQIETTDIKITYTIRISNKGEIEGTVNRLTELIPQGYRFYQEDNELHWEEENGILETEALTDEIIQPGSYKEIEVVLRWNGGEENFGEKNNIVMISKLSNPARYEDIDEKDNRSKSQMLLTVATGLDRSNKSMIIGVILIGLVISIGILVNYKKKVK